MWGDVKMNYSVHLWFGPFRLVTMINSLLPLFFLWILLTSTERISPALSFKMLFKSNFKQDTLAVRNTSDCLLNLFADLKEL